jgi:hypothetical protein
MKRRAFIALIGGLAIAWPLACYAQQPTRAPSKRVGLLSQLPCPIPPDIIRRRLAELGWIEGQTFVFDCVSAVGRLDQTALLRCGCRSFDPSYKGVKTRTHRLPVGHTSLRGFAFTSTSPKSSQSGHFNH